MLKYCVLGSGSSGNCSFISDGKTSLLLDAGFSAKEIIRRLKSAQLDGSAISGIVISHEHGDHARGAGVIARKLSLPIYINRRTYERTKNVIGDKVTIKHFENGSTFRVGSIGVEPFSIPHDAADPSAFIFQNENRKLAHVTDIGYATDLLKNKVTGADYIVIEANHEPEMLQAGPYPWPLKQRIASRSGHLSNNDCKELLEKVIHSNLQGVTFAHLSETNNNPDLVAQIGEQTLGGVSCHVASQSNPGPVVVVE